MTPSNYGQYGPNPQPPIPENRTVMSPVFKAPNSFEASLPLASQADPNRKMFAGDSLPTLSLPAVKTKQLNVNNVVNSATLPVVPTTADDNDLIEKEWLLKAKKIVKDNRDDPHRQSKELTLFKSDYMQKRYNKTIKMGE